MLLRLWRLRLLPCPACPAGGRNRACLPLDVVIVACPHVVPGFCVLKTGGPLLVPCSLCSLASEFLSFFLGIFRGGSSGISSSHYWSLLNWRHLSVFRLASAGGHSPLWPSGWRLRSSAAAEWSRPGMGGCLSPPPSGEAGRGNPCTLVHRPEFLSGESWSLLDFPWRGGFGGLLQVFSCLALSVLSEASPTFHRLISSRYGCV